MTVHTPSSARRVARALTSSPKKSGRVAARSHHIRALVLSQGEACQVTRTTGLGWLAAKLCTCNAELSPTSVSKVPSTAAKQELVGDAMSAPKQPCGARTLPRVRAQRDVQLRRRQRGAQAHAHRPGAVQRRALQARRHRLHHRRPRRLRAVAHCRQRRRLCIVPANSHHWAYIRRKCFPGTLHCDNRSRTRAIRQRAIYTLEGIPAAGCSRAPHERRAAAAPGGAGRSSRPSNLKAARSCAQPSARKAAGSPPPSTLAFRQTCQQPCAPRPPSRTW